MEEKLSPYIKKLSSGQYVVEKSIIPCPNCEHLASFNSHFGAFICNHCHWTDDSYNKLR